MGERYGLNPANVQTALNNFSIAFQNGAKGFFTKAYSTLNEKLGGKWASQRAVDFANQIDSTFETIAQTIQSCANSILEDVAQTIQTNWTAATNNQFTITHETVSITVPQYTLNLQDNIDGDIFIEKDLLNNAVNGLKTDLESAFNDSWSAIIGTIKREEALFGDDQGLIFNKITIVMETASSDIARNLETVCNSAIQAVAADSISSAQTVARADVTNSADTSVAGIDI